MAQVSNRGADAAHGRRGCRRRRRRRWATSIRRSSRGGSTHCSRGERFDLIFVHCSSVAQYCRARARARAEDPRLRRHGFAEVAGVRALQAVPAVARLPARRERSWSAPRSALARRFDLCTATTRAEWETLEELRHRRRHGLVSERRRQRLLRAESERPTTPTRSASSAAWTTTRTRSACSTSAPGRCRCCGRAGPR